MAYLLFYTCKAHVSKTIHHSFIDRTASKPAITFYRPDEGNNEVKKNIIAFLLLTTYFNSGCTQFSETVLSKRTRRCVYECVPLPKNPRSPSFLAELQSLN